MQTKSHIQTTSQEIMDEDIECLTESLKGTCAEGFGFKCIRTTGFYRGVVEVKFPKSSVKTKFLFVG